MVVLITYDLNKPGQQYSELYKKIKEMGVWWHYLDSVWLLDTNYTVHEISENLKPSLIDKNDYLFVVRLRKDYAGWLPRKAWDWIEGRSF